MKILYKIVLFLVLVQLTTLLVSSLGVFPAGSLPYSDTNRLLDENGDLTVNSIMDELFSDFEVDINIPIISSFFGSTHLAIGWGSVTVIFLAMIGLSFFLGASSSILATALMAYWMVSMLWWSKSWFEDIAGNYPAVIGYLVTIIMFGIVYLYVVTYLESHQQGDVGDR
jgi:hypothetical protein